MAVIEGILSNGEWLSKITCRLRLTPISTFVILAVFNTILDISLALVFDAWRPRLGSAGLSGEYAAWFYIILAQPAVVAYFVWLQSAGKTVFDSLNQEGVITTEGGLEKELNLCKKRYESHKARVAAWLIAIVVVLWFNFAANEFIFSFPYPSWFTIHPIIVLLFSPVTFLVYYSLVLVVYDVAVIVLALRGLFKNNQIRVEPMHPDGAGGFGAIGRFSANLGYGIAVLGLAFAASIIQDPTFFYVAGC